MLNRRKFLVFLGAAAATVTLPAVAGYPVRFVRPKRAGNYGAGDGSSYENAWNGFSAMSDREWGTLNAAGVSSTLWVCGTHAEYIDFVSYQSEFGGAGFTAAGRQDGLVIRGDYPGDPGIIDTRANDYAFMNRQLGPHAVYDRWLAGLNSNAGALCASVNFRTACNITIKSLTIYAGASPLNCTQANNPAAKRMDLYYPPGDLVPCNAEPYNGISIYYPQNIAIFSNNGSRNIRITGCTIVGNGKNSRAPIGLQGGGGKPSIIMIDGNDISGFLKGINMSFGQHNVDLAVSIRNNKIHDLGFSDGDHDFVDGIVCYADFNNRNQSCEIVGNDISGFYQDGVDLFYAGGVLVKDNYIHDGKLTRIAYMSPPHWNADESNGDQNGIKFGGDGSFGGNRIIGNVVVNMLTAGISSNNTGNRAIIANNLVVNADPDFGGDGISIFGTQSILNVVANNTVVGYKRGIRCESENNSFFNNICRSVPKSSTYINGARPQADILFSGSGAARGNRTFTNLLVNNLFVKQNGAASQDVGNLAGNPRFRNEAKKDFRLKPGSPYAGAGTYPGFDLTDENGVPLKQPYPLGAYRNPV